MGTSSGQKEVLQSSPLQIMGNQCSSRRFGSIRGGPIIKTGLVRLVESLGQEVRGKVGQGTRVSQNSSGEINRLDGTSNCGHFATNVGDNIWVIATIDRDAIIAEELAI